MICNGECICTHVLCRVYMYTCVGTCDIIYLIIEIVCIHMYYAECIYTQASAHVT